MYWLWYILIGAVAGWIAGRIVKGSGSGLLLNIVIGIVGGLLGGWLFRLMNLPTGTMFWSLVAAIVGAIILLLIVSLFSRKKT